MRIIFHDYHRLHEYINAKYNVCSIVRRATQQYGFKEVGDEDEWTLYWTDLSVSLERVMDMKKFQVS